MSNIGFCEYPKIYGPYKRHVSGPYRNKLIIGDWSNSVFQITKDLEWIWTEKVDGTNIRIYWDGYSVQFGGRTPNAQIPAKLVTVLNEKFTEEIFEQVFGGTEVLLFGEGYGNSIQKAGINYKADGVDFVLFDMRIGSFWLLHEDVEDIAHKMGINAVPVVEESTVQYAIDRISNDFICSEWGPFIVEGLVGVLKGGLLDRSGRRIQMKIKTIDFRKK